MKRSHSYIILVTLCFLVYYNSLQGAFVSDDIPAIVNNPSIGKPFIYWAHPSVLLISFNYLAAKFNPFLYHLTNVILHAIVTIAVFYFLGLFFNPETSLLGAGLFAAHPVHAEAVSWISGSTYIILALFIFITYFLYLRAMVSEKKARLFYYTLALVIFSYYLYRNYAFYFLFPLFLVVSDLVFKRWRKNWLWWLPFFLIVGLRILLARAEIGGRIAYVAKDANAGGAIDWSNPFFNLAYSFFSHTWLLVFPSRLTLYHEPPTTTYAFIVTGLIILGLLLCALPFIFKKAKPVFLALVMVILFLAPTYSPVLISWLVAERYLYFPSVSLSLIACFFYARYVNRGEDSQVSKKQGKKQELPEGLLARRRKAVAVFIFLIACYGARTVVRNQDWKTPARLWRSTVEVSDASPRAHNNMGDVYGQEENTEGAIKEFKRAIELKPDYADAYHNLANTYQKAGRTREAIEYYVRALSFNPGLVESHYNLGVIYLHEGILDLAREHLQKALELRPDDQSIAYALNFAREKEK